MPVSRCGELTALERQLWSSSRTSTDFACAKVGHSALRKNLSAAPHLGSAVVALSTHSSAFDRSSVAGQPIRLLENGEQGNESQRCHQQQLVIINISDDPRLRLATNF
jgi:hypothetical protein